MNKIHFAFFLVYRWYQVTGKVYSQQTGRSAGSAYRAAVIGYLAFIFLNIITLSVLFKSDLLLKPPDRSFFVQGIRIGILYLAPGYMIFTRFIKEEDIMYLSYSESELKRGYLFLLIYVFLSFILYTTAVIIHNI